MNNKLIETIQRALIAFCDSLGEEQDKKKLQKEIRQCLYDLEDLKDEAKTTS